MKLRHKLLAGLLPLALATALSVGVGTFSLIHSAVEKRYYDRLRAESALLASWLAAPGKDGRPWAASTDTDALQEWAKRWAQLLEVRVSLLDRGGTVVADSLLTVGEIERLDNHRDRPEILDAARDRIGRSLRKGGGGNERFYFFARRVEPTRGVATVRLALPERRVRDAQAAFIWPVMSLSMLSLAIVSTLAYVGALLLSRPIEAIAASAGAISRGDLHHDVPRANTRELDRLSRAISGMRDTMLAKIAELEARRELLDSVVSGMRGGVLVVDSESRIRLANEMARSLLHADGDPTGQKLSEAVHNREILNLLAGIMINPDARHERFASPGIDPRYFDIYAAPLAPVDETTARGVLVLLYDITRLEVLEELRQKFIADLSHELRTPLTSIQAAAGTLLDGAASDEAVCGRFLDTISRQAKRMAALLSDLADLSRIETGAISLELETFDVVPLIHDILDQLAPRYASQQLEVSLEIKGELLLTVDRLRFEQIMVNLLDNAMKFNRAGGFVRISGSGPVLRIADSGPGISQDNVTRVFHRFFRLDPARSRKRGGTGLGLAIVKHLVTLHGARVWVESELGQGSVFVLDFS